MTFVSRDQLTFSDIFAEPTCHGIPTYSDYDAVYKQDTNQLCRFPELFEILENGVSIEYCPNWGYFRFSNTDKIPLRNICNILYNAFATNRNIAIVLNHGYVEVRDSPKYIDEPFEVMRNRCLFEVRDLIEKSHYGVGSDSKMLKSKYTGRFFKLVQEKWDE